MTQIQSLMARIAEINTANGWRETDLDALSPNLLAKVQTATTALIVTEASEAIEEIRDGHAVTETYFSGGDEGNRGLTPDRSRDVNGDLRKPEGFPSELADVIIRSLDIADAWDIDIEAAIDLKLAYNAQRGYRHGGKTL